VAQPVGVEALIAQLAVEALDEPFLFTPEYCKQAVAQVFGENVNKVNMPAEYLLMNRISFGLNSILSQLGARENFYRLARHCYFDEAPRPPADE